MRPIAIALFLALGTGVATAGPITDMQSDVYAVGDWVTIQGVVTAAATYGVAVAEAPYSARNAVWVYLGSGHGVAAGALLQAHGVYEEYNGLTELNVFDHLADPAPGPAWSAVTGSAPVPAPSNLSAAQLMADPEPWESCVVTVTDALIVAEKLLYGEWTTESYESGTLLTLDDFWYDASAVEVGDCFQNATGMFTYSFGVYKLEPFAAGLPPCGPVAAQDRTLGAVKGLYR